MSIEIKLTLTGYSLKLAQELKIDLPDMNSDQYQSFSDYGNVKYYNEAVRSRKGYSFMSYLTLHPPQSYEAMFNKNNKSLYVLHHGFILGEYSSVILSGSEGFRMVNWDCQGENMPDLDQVLPDFARWLKKDAIELLRN